MTTLDEADAVWGRHPTLPREYMDARVATVILDIEKAHADALTLLRWASDCWQDGELRGDFDDCVDAIRVFLPARPTPAREG